MAGSEQFSVGFIDSGTTFSYFPSGLFNMLLMHFDWFCGIDTKNHCKGSRILSGANSNQICFNYDQSKFPKGPKDYFASYPILKFHIRSNTSEPIYFNWYPSEYLYREKET